jgi:hypothetical protein
VVVVLIAGSLISKLFVRRLVLTRGIAFEVALVAKLGAAIPLWLFMGLGLSGIHKIFTGVNNA